MAEKVKLGMGITVDGEKEFKKAISGINSDMKVLASEMKKTSAEFDENKNSIEALTAKDKVLTSQIEKQKEKVDALKKALANSKQEFGDNDTRTDKWKVSLNNAEAQLSKMDRELSTNNKYLDEAKKSTNNTATSIDNFGKEIKEAETKTSTFGDVLKANLTSQAIIGGVKTLASGLKDLGTSVVDVAKDTAEYADDINTMSNVTGLATDTIQELKYMEDLTDVSTETVTGSMKKQIKAMSNAQSGSKQYAEAYKKLGVSVEDSNGNLRDSEEVYWDVVDALGKMQNETERDATAMVLMGKSAQDLNPLIQIGKDGFNQFAEEAKSVGAVMSTDTLSSLNEAQDAMDRLSQNVLVAKRNFGAELAPTLTTASIQISQALQDNKQEIISLARDGVELLTDSITWVLEHKDALISGIKATGTALVTLKAGMVINDVSKALKGVGGASEVASKGVAKFITSIKAHPALIAASVAIGTLVAVSETAKASFNKNNAELVSSMEKTKSEIEKQQSDLQTLKANMESTANQIGDTATSSTNIGNLTTQLFALEQQTNKTATQKAQMKTIVDQLNIAVPNLNLSYNAEKDALNMTDAAIKSTTASFIEQARAAAYAQAILTTNEQIITQEQKVEEATKAVTRAQNDYNEAQAALGVPTGDLLVDQWNNIKGAVTGATGKVGSAAKEIDKANGNLEEQKQTLSDLKNRLKNYESTVTGTTESAKGDVGEVRKMTVKWGNETKVATENTAAGFLKAKKAYEDAKAKAKESLSSQISLFQDWSNQSSLSVSEMKKNFDDQAKAMNDWADNLKKASAKGISKGLLEELANMGPEAAGYLANLANATDDEVKAMNTSWKNREKGEDAMADSVVSATTKLKSKVDKTFSEIPKTASYAMKNAANAIDSQYSVFVSSGSYSMSGVISGIESQMPALRAEGVKAGNEVNSAFNATLKIESPSKVFKKSGGYIVEGIVNGIDDSLDDAKKSSANLGTETYNALNTSLDIHSPSKLTQKTGSNYVNGLVKGINDSKGAAKKSVKELGEILIDKLNNHIEFLDLKKNRERNATELKKYWAAAVKATKNGGSSHIEALKNYYQARNDVINGKKSAISDYKSEIKSYNSDFKSALAEEKKNLSSSLKDLKSTYNSGKKDLKTQLTSDIASANESYNSALKSRASSIAGTGLFSQFTTDRSQSKKGLMADLQSQVDGITAFNTNMESLRTRGLDASLMQALEDQGISGAGQIAQIAQMTDEELKSYTDLYAQKQKLAKDEAIKEEADTKAQTDSQILALKTSYTAQANVLKEQYTKDVAQAKADSKTTSNAIRKEYVNNIKSAKAEYVAAMKEVGLNTAKGLAEGIKSGNSLVKTAIKSLSKDMVKQIKKDLGIHSPSTVFMELGEYTGQGMEIGLTDSTKDLSNIVTTALPQSIDVPKISTPTSTVNGENYATPNLGNATFVIQMGSEEVARQIVPWISLLQGNSANLLMRGASIR